MLAKAQEGFYSEATCKRLKADMDLLWKNIQIFNMPNTEEYLEGFKFNIFANYALKFFEEILEKPLDNYLFDDNEQFLIRNFYEFKNLLIKNYLNLISKHYSLNNGVEILAILEEKDKRSISSKERNKMTHLLGNKKMKNLELKDLYESDKFQYELEKKSFSIEIRGINMNKMDYSLVESIPITPAFKSFLKQNSIQVKKSVPKLYAESRGDAQQTDHQQMSPEQSILPEEEKVTVQASLSQLDIFLLTQINYWIVTPAAEIYYNQEIQPVAIKLHEPSDLLRPVCLLSG
jgi:hypothetical protein